MFVGRVARPVAIVFRTLCENRTRQRRKLHKQMSDWSILQAEAIGLDQKVERDNQVFLVFLVSCFLFLVVCPVVEPFLL